MPDRRVSALVGAATLLLIVGGFYVLTLFLGGSFKSGYEVSATFARAGQLLRAGSDVKLRGVLVGEVTAINIAPSGRAKVKMRLVPDQQIPDNVEAAIRAKTLFGEKFIDFVIPKQASAQRLVAGDEIPQSRTVPPIEVETILEKAVPVLDAVDPEQFAAGLHALAESFGGNEQALRHATLQGEALLTGTERTLPNLERNLIHLKHFAAALDQSDTSLLLALDGLARVGDAIRNNPDAFKSTVSGLVPVAQNLGDVFTARQSDLNDLAGKQRAILDLVDARASKLPTIVTLLDGFLGVWVQDLSAGPYWRISLTNPPVVGGTPYPAGGAPQPRSTSRSALHGRTPVKGLLDILLAPVSGSLKEPVASLDPLLAGLP